MAFEVSTRGFTILICGSLALAACNRDAVANPPAASDNVAASAQQPVATEAKGQYDEAAFALSLSPKAAVQKGQPGELVVTLTAKAPFHVNQEYPHRFKVTNLHGLATPSNTISRDPAKVTPPRLDMAIPVTLGQDGPFALEGEMSFSVCTDEKCLMEKRMLKVDLSPK